MTEGDILERAIEKNPKVKDYGMGFSGRTGHLYRWKNRCKGTVVGTCLDCSEHSNHHVPTGMAEKVGAVQLGLRMEIENYKPKSSRSYGSH